MNNAVRSRLVMRAGVSLAALTVGILAVSGAHAQTAPSPQDDGTVVDEVIVTGFRGSLQNAIERKRQSNEIIDVISAEDLADFPDANLAESLQRVPGVAIERDGGEGRGLTVRGLGGDFSRTRLNGLEALSTTTGSTLGSNINRGRGFDYSIFASELFSSLTVRKTQSAEVDEGSLGATIDLQTGRPFDKRGLQGVFGATAAYYENGETFAPRLTGLISNTWMDDKFGALVSFAYSTRDVVEEAYSNTGANAGADFSDVLQGFCPVVPGSSVRPVNPSVGTASFTPQCMPAPGAVPGSTPAAYNAINQPNIFLPRLPGYGRFLNEQERLGVTAAFQFEPNPDTLFNVDLAYSRFDQTKQDQATNPISLNRGNAGASLPGVTLTPLQRSGRPNMKIREVEIDENGLVRFMRFDDTDFRTTSTYDQSTTEFWQASIGLRQNLGDRGQLNVLYGRSDSFFDNPDFRLMSLDRFDSDGFTYDSRDSRQSPRVDFGFNAADPNSWSFYNGYSDIRLISQTVENTFENLKADVRYDLTDSFTLKFGAAIKEFKFESESQRRIVATTLVPTLPAGTTIADISNLVTGFGDRLDLSPGSMTSFVVPDIMAISDLFDVLCNCVNAFGDFRTGPGGGSAADNRNVSERSITPYIQLDFDFPVFTDMTLRGNVGVRYAKTEQESSGFVGTTLVNASREYDDVLPALNLSLEITPDLIARFGAAKVMSRPALPQLTPGGSVSAAEPFTATVGNPDLDPIRATNLDASIEWYFGQGAILSGAVFYKDIASFTQQVTAQTTIADSGLPSLLFPTGQNPGTAVTLTTFENTPGGELTGLEISYQQPFTFLPGLLANTGMLLNYTHIESEITYLLSPSPTGPTLSAPLINVSPDSFNGTIYYEDERFSARISAAYRSEYLRFVPLRAGLADSGGSYENLNFDASATYNVNERLAVTFDALNLTDQATDFWNGQERRDQSVFSRTGRQFFIGARFRY
ncbi:TonB-dependent receptor [Brevundimonas sp. TWP2-3-4b1]|uniref:TonB-dependent receptor n=1 Tax=Brevundimonas sp. TWP2-3-4b1 TaxID=2804580 RepID=UPI003CF5AE0D